MIQGKRPKLVIWCTELAAIRTITDAMVRTTDLVWTRDAQTFLRAAGDESPPLAVIVDNSAAKATAIESLQAIRKSRPEARRILMTDYCDLAIIIQGLHTEAVQRIVYKPVHPAELLAAIGMQSVVTVPQRLYTSPATRAAG